MEIMCIFCVSPTPSGYASLISVAISATGDLNLNLLGVTEYKAATENGKLQGEEKKSVTGNLNNILPGSKWKGKIILTNSTLAESLHGHQHGLTHSRRPFWRAASWCVQSLSYIKGRLPTPSQPNDCMNSATRLQKQQISLPPTEKAEKTSWGITLNY